MDTKFHQPGPRQVGQIGKEVVISGNDRYHLLAKLTGGLSGFPFKYTGEVGLIIVAKVKADFCNGLVGG